MSLDKASCFVWFVNPLTLKVAGESILSWFNSHWIKYSQSRKCRYSLYRYSFYLLLVLCTSNKAIRVLPHGPCGCSATATRAPTWVAYYETRNAECGTTAEHPKTTRNTPEQRNHTKRKTIVVFLREILNLTSIHLTLSTQGWNTFYCWYNLFIYLFLFI